MKQIRTIVPEKATQEQKHGAKAVIWTPKMLEALGNGVKGGKWFSLIDKVYRYSTLAKAWEKVRRNRGAAGVDKQTIEAFDHKADLYLRELSKAIETGTYKPSPVKRVEIAKGGGKTRPLGIPTVKDRIAQTAVLMVIEPIFEAQFLDVSYGFRPERGAKDALREVDRLIKQGYTFVVDADIKGYFDAIPHDKLMSRVKESISDGALLRLLEEWLKQDIVSDCARWTPTVGTPQGAVISPLLANLYLHYLDKLISGHGYKMARYADDFVILCTDEEEAKEVLEVVKCRMDNNELTLHPDKTHLGDCRNKGEGFEFLGYRFEAGRRYVRKKSMLKLRERIRELTPRNCGFSLDIVIERVNRTLKGWFNYFKQAYKATFPYVDGFVRRRLRAILLKQNKRKGVGKTLMCHMRWPNVYFAKRGLFTTHEAYLQAYQSR
jgi:RNA-directed DNA polymerase